MPLHHIIYQRFQFITPIDTSFLTLAQGEVSGCIGGAGGARRSLMLGESTFFNFSKKVFCSGKIASPGR